MTRLHLTLAEIRKMIARLPEVEELPWGRELKERWTAEGRAGELRQIIERRDEDLKHYEDLFRNGILPDAAYRDLTARAEKDVQQCRADLADIENRSR
jgi:hypothetical protein